MAGLGLQIFLPDLSGYSTVTGQQGKPNDADQGTGIVTGPDNGWYTYTGTIAEIVRSEADGHWLPGEVGPMHQVEAKVKCANYTPLR